MSGETVLYLIVGPALAAFVLWMGVAELRGTYSWWRQRSRQKAEKPVLGIPFSPLSFLRKEIARVTIPVGGRRLQVLSRLATLSLQGARPRLDGDAVVFSVSGRPIDMEEGSASLSAELVCTGASGEIVVSLQWPRGAWFSPFMLGVLVGPFVLLALFGGSSVRDQVTALAVLSALVLLVSVPPLRRLDEAVSAAFDRIHAAATR